MMAFLTFFRGASPSATPSSQPLSHLVYRACFRFVATSVFFLVFLAGGVFFYFFIHDKSKQINKECVQTAILSEYAVSQLDMARSMFTSLHGHFDPGLKSDSIKHIMKSILLSAPSIDGACFKELSPYPMYEAHLDRKNPSFNLDRSTLSKKNETEEGLNKYWVHRLIQKRKPLFYMHPKNHLGSVEDSVFLYPFFDHGRIFAVGSFFMHNKRLLSSIQHDNQSLLYDFYVQDLNASHAGRAFYRSVDLSSPNGGIRIPLSWSLPESGWVWHGLHLYRIQHDLHGSFNLLIRFNLDFLMTMGFAFLCFMFCVLSLIFYTSSYFVRKKADDWVYPLTHLSDQLKKISFEDYDHPLSVPEMLYSKEVRMMYRSVESLRQRLKAYLFKDRVFQRKQANLDLAKKIQHAFFHESLNPSQFYASGLDASTHFMPGNDVSGDVMDIKLSGDSVYCFVADASGKDAGAAIYSMFVLSRFRMLASQGLDPKLIMDSLNRYLFSIQAEGMFITALCLKFMPSENRCLLANAGHTMPLCIPSSVSAPIPVLEGDLVLGLKEDERYRQLDFQASDSACMLLFTDGLTENAWDGHALDIQSVEACLAQTLDLDVESQLDSVLKVIGISKKSNDYPEDKPVSLSEDASQDDTSIMLLRFLNPLENHDE